MIGAEVEHGEKTRAIEDPAPLAAPMRVRRRTPPPGYHTVRRLRGAGRDYSLSEVGSHWPCADCRRPARRFRIFNQTIGNRDRDGFVLKRMLPRSSRVFVVMMVERYWLWRVENNLVKRLEVC